MQMTYARASTRSGSLDVLFKFLDMLFYVLLKHHLLGQVGVKEKVPAPLGSVDRSA
jgi:hypothetical protein